MEALPTIAIAVLGPALFLICAAVVLRFARVTAQPDEWLLRVRNGKVLDAGIGIWLWRKPGDVVARFSSALQRVRFTVEAPSAEHLPVKIEGFILWSLAPDGERVFRAFSKLGHRQSRSSASGTEEPGALAHERAASRISGAARGRSARTRRHAVAHRALDRRAKAARRSRTTAERSRRPTRDRSSSASRYFEIEPADSGLGRELAARSEERVREEAAGVRLEAAARLRERQADQALRQAAEELELRHAKAEGERRIAENERDTALVRNFADEQKSQAVRDHELARFVVEKTACAMASWQIREAKWIQLGNASPVASVASALLDVREILAETAPTAAENTRGAA